MDHKRNSGLDFSKELDEMKDITEKINDAYEKIAADDPGDGKKKHDSKQLAKATAPLRRQIAMQQVAVDVWLSLCVFSYSVVKIYNHTRR